MSRKMLFSVLALLPAAAMAGPPGTSTTPLNVTVTNPVLQVEVANADAVPVSVETTPVTLWHDSFAGATDGTSNYTGYLDIFPAGAMLTTVSVSISTGAAPEATSATCIVKLTLGGSTTQEIFRAFASPAGEVNQVIPFPDVPVGGRRVELEYTSSNVSHCVFSANVYAKVPTATP